jgi:uncharacterized membrane protein YfcA
MVAVGHIGWRELALSASGLVPMAAGLLAGKALRQRLDDRWFRRVLLAFLVMLAVLLLLK